MKYARGHTVQTIPVCRIWDRFSVNLFKTISKFCNMSCNYLQCATSIFFQLSIINNYGIFRFSPRLFLILTYFSDLRSEDWPEQNINIKDCLWDFNCVDFSWWAWTLSCGKIASRLFHFRLVPSWRRKFFFSLNTLRLSSNSVSYCDANK